MYLNIEAERARLQMSQEELVKRIGISRKTYYTKQKNETFSKTELEKMSDIFKCPIEYLSETSTLEEISKG